MWEHLRHFASWLHSDMTQFRLRHFEKDSYVWVHLRRVRPWHRRGQGSSNLCYARYRPYRPFASRKIRCGAGIESSANSKGPKEFLKSGPAQSLCHILKRDEKGWTLGILGRWQRMLRNTGGKLTTRDCGNPIHSETWKGVLSRFLDVLRRFSAVYPLCHDSWWVL